MKTDLNKIIPVEKAALLLNDLSALIESGRSQVAAAVNSAVTITYWQMGKRINEEILHGERAEYGKQVVVSISRQLVERYGKSFENRNLRRMMQFADTKLALTEESTLSGNFKDPYWINFMCRSRCRTGRTAKSTERQYHGCGILDRTAAKRTSGEKTPLRIDRGARETGKQDDY